MLFNVQRRWLYLSIEQVRAVVAEILGPDGQRGLAAQLYGSEHDWLSVWHRVAAEAHRRVTWNSKQNLTDALFGLRSRLSSLARTAPR